MKPYEKLKEILWDNLDGDINLDAIEEFFNHKLFDNGIYIYPWFYRWNEFDNNGKLKNMGYWVVTKSAGQKQIMTWYVGKNKSEIVKGKDLDYFKDQCENKNNYLKFKFFIT